MGKILKYCPLCQKSFTQDFTYCPNCASALNSEGFTHSKIADDDFNVTLFEEKSRNKRYTFILGASVFVMSGAIFSIVASIYNKDVYVKALDESLVYVASITEDDPIKLEELELPNNKRKGGGGSGGDNDPNPVSKGVLASQSEKPLIAPSVSMVKVTDPAIKIRMETKGVVERKPTDQPYGDKNSKYTVLSDGDGDNGGQGNGNERGQGPGKGPGSGPGDGPGYGPGPGGPGGVSKTKETPEDEKPPEIKPANVGETVAMKILSKPRAIYTEAARKNERSGTVTLRVSFMANGSIGNIVVVSGLPDGLTEQAIAAAKTIQFEPAKKNGSPVSVTRQVQYTFTMY